MASDVVPGHLPGPVPGDPSDGSGGTPVRGSSYPGRRLVLAGTVIAWMAIGCFAAAAVLASLPVKNQRPELDRPATTIKQRASEKPDVYVFEDGSKTLQDCGAPVIFVATGRLESVYGGGKNPLEKARASYANRHSCSSRVASRLVPAGLLVLSTLVLTGLAGALTLIGRSRSRRARSTVAPLSPAPEPIAASATAPRPRRAGWTAKL